MKLELNLVGNTFTYLHGGNKGYSVHGKESQYIEWVQDGSGEVTCYIDGWMEGFSRDDSRKYGWLLESQYISNMSNAVKNDPQLYLDNFEMIFTHDRELITLSDQFKFVPGQGSWIKEPSICEKTKLVSMISSTKTMTDGHYIRLGWVEKLKGGLDLYGRGFNEIEFKEQGLCDYMFSVAIENGCYETYFTEKILDCFLTGTIPIYLGTPDIGDYFNLDGIIVLDENFNLNELSKELYESKLSVIHENFQLAQPMEMLEDYMYLNYLS